MEEYENAVSTTSQTLIGVNLDKFPVTRGNCFGVRTESGKEYRIVNFSIENLEELQKRGVEFPIRIKPISETKAVIHDVRIPHNWYDGEWCEVCCPTDLLPLPQKLRHDRKVESGELSYSEPTKIMGMETKFVRQSTDEFHEKINEPENKLRRQKMRAWRCETSMDAGFVYCPNNPTAIDLNKEITQEIKQEDIDKLK